MNSRIDLKKLITTSSKEAIDQVEALLTQKNDEQPLNLLFIIKGDLIEIERMYTIGVSSFDDYRRGINRINLNLLKIIDDLPNNYFQPASEKIGSHELTNFELEVSALVRELGELEVRESETQNGATKGYINSKRYVVAVQATRLIQQYSMSISSLEYSMIAYSFFRSVDVVKAEQMYKKAIENIDEYTDSAQSKISAIRSFANFLYSINRHQDGAKQYESAVLEGNSETDNVTNGFTFQMKFGNECDIQDYENAVISYRKAKEYYMKMGNTNVKIYNLSGLEAVWNEKRIPPNFSRP